MAFDRDIWNDFKVSEKQPTRWLCGNCFSGNLTLLIDKVVHSKEDRFSGLVKCTNPKCAKSYAVSGVYKYFSSLLQVEVPKENVLAKYKQYHPLFFSPSIRLFKINPLQSKALERELDYAFGHFWNDYSACANAIRRSIEVLLNDLNVDELENLHQRIERFQKTNNDIGNKLMSIKWIGNAGSHKEKPTREDLLDAFEILEYCLEHLFPNHERVNRINSITDAINQNKNIRSKQ